MRRVTSLLATGPVAALVVGVSAASGATAADPTMPGPYRVASAEYTLGDQALRVPGFHEHGDGDGKRSLAPIELIQDPCESTTSGYGPRSRSRG